MADYGLLGALGEGLKTGMQSYQTERNYHDQKRKESEERIFKKNSLEQQALKDRMAQRIQLASHGLKEGDDGSIGETEGKIAEREANIAVKRAQAKHYETGKQQDPLTKELALYRLKEASDKQEDRNFKQSPKGRLESAGGDVKQKIGFVTSALENLTNYEDRFRKGDRQSRLNPQTPLIGGLVSSTPIDESRTNLEESIGRLQSGGAISKEEEERFRRMIPTPADDDETGARKLLQLRSEMENRLTGYGFKSDELGDLGFEPKKLGYLSEYSIQPNRGLLDRSIKSNVQGGGLIPTTNASDEIPKKVIQGGIEYTLNPKTGQYE